MLVDEILNEVVELFLHASDLWWDNVSQGFVHHWCMSELNFDGVIEFDEILAVRHRDLRSCHDGFEEHIFCLVFSHFGQALSLREFVLVIGVIVRWDLSHQRPTLRENLLRSVSCASSFTHLLTLFFRLCKSVYAQDLPCARFEILVVIEENSGPLPLLKFLNVPIHLRGLMSLLEVLRDLERNFRKELRSLLLLGGKLVEEVLGLSQHESAQAGQGFGGEIRARFSRLERRHILFEVLENPCRLLHIFTGVLDAVPGKVHVARNPGEANTNVVFGAHGIKHR